MNILVLGATGFLGAEVSRALIQRGSCQVFCAVRDVDAAAKQFPQATFIPCDFLQDTQPEKWLPRLDNMDIIINCVGLFYHRDKKVLWDIHYNTPKALFTAAAQAGVKKIIHISALGIENYQNEYSDSKRAAEVFLHSLKLPHVILKPSFIYGLEAVGGMALLRGLAALPGLIPLPGSGDQKFQPIQVKDLAASILNLIQVDTGASLTLAAVSKEAIRLKTILSTFRTWLGLKKGIFIHVPISLIKIMALVGSYFSNSSINLPAIQMLEQGNSSTKQEAEKFAATAGIIPMPFTKGVECSPATPSIRWYATLFFTPSLLRVSLAFTWIASAVTSLLPHSKASSFALLTKVGLPDWLQPLFLYGAVCINALIGLSLLMHYKTKCNCLIQMVLIVIYTLIITIKLPYLWLEPFGPIIKNLPLLMSIWILYAMESD